MLDPVRERCAAFHPASHLLLHPLCFSFPDLGGGPAPTCIGKPPTRGLGSAGHARCRRRRLGPGQTFPWRRETGPPSLPRPVVSVSGQVRAARCLQLAWCPAAGGRGCGWRSVLV